MKETKKCPFCGGEILAVAKKCKHCKQFIEKKENKADEITKDIDTSSNTPAIKDKKNQMIVAITIVAFIVIIIVGFVSCTSNSLFTGCKPDNTNADNYMVWECKDNKYYDKIHIYNIKRGKPDYVVYKYISKPNGYNGSYRLGRQVYNSRDSKYTCYSDVQHDVVINNCNAAKFTKLMKESAPMLRNEYFAGWARQDMKETISSIISARRNLVYITSEIKEVAPLMRLEKIYNFKLPENCREITEELNKNEKLIDYKLDSCQMKFKNNNIVALSEDGKKATIYNNDKPEYYISFTVQDNVDSDYGYFQIKYVYIDEKIPAYDYIKNTNNLYRFTKEEMTKRDFEEFPEIN